MQNEHRLTLLNRYVMVILVPVAFLVSGCMIHRNQYSYEDTLSPESMNWVRKGSTPKKELFRHLGPPAAIVRAETAEITPFTLKTKVRPTAAWQYFRKNHDIHAHHRLFYYYYIEAIEYQMEIGDTGRFPVKSSLIVHNLWFLVGRFGMIEDIYFDEKSGYRK